jgi:hypothetical protein
MENLSSGIATEAKRRNPLFRLRTCETAAISVGGISNYTEVFLEEHFF